MQFAAGDRVGPYEIRSLLGAGGMGEVYRADDPRLGRDIALKMLPAAWAADPERRARFHREARAAAALNHPNICTIHEIGEADGQLYIAMEFLDGATLSESLASGPAPMSVAEVLDIGIQVAEALDAAREKHIVHRDLKSGNIVLLSNGQVKVLDFGLAKQTAADDVQTMTAGRATQAGTVVGTVAYMSPEQALGETVDHRSDLFSFGVVLYELLAGRLPFTGRTTTAMLDALLHQEPPPLARFNDQVPAALTGIVKKLLAKEVGNRYQSAADVLADLRRTRENLAAAGRTDGTAAVKARRWRKAAAAVAGVVLVVACLALAAWHWWPPVQAPMTPTRAASLVALPTKVMGPPEFQYLTDAIPAVLTSHLANVPDFITKQQPSSTEVDSVKGDVQKVARAYGVDLCLLSSVTAQRDSLLVILELVDPATRAVVWSHAYEGSPSQYLSLVRDAADGVRAAMRPSAAAIRAPGGQPANAAAMLALQKGQFFSNRYNNKHEPADFDAARAAFDEALRLDPALADAAAEMAFLLGFKIESGASAAELVPQMDRWATQAVALDPRNGKSWAARSWVETLQGTVDISTIREHSFRAGALAPRSGFVQSFVSSNTNLVLTLSIPLAREVHRLDPLYQVGAANLAQILFAAGRSEEGLRVADEADALDPGGFIVLQTKALLLADLHRVAPATSALAELRAALAGGKYPLSFFLTAEIPVLLEKGDLSGAQAALTRLHAFANDPASVYVPVVIYPVLPFLARHGRVDDALRLMKACADRGAPPDYDWLVLDPRFAPLRADPRFAPMRDKSRAAFVDQLKDIDAARARREFPKYLEQPLAELRAKLGM